MKHSTFLIGLLAAMLSLLSVQTAQAADKLTISSASASIAPYSTNYVTNVYDGNTSTIYWSNGPQTSSTYVQVVLQEESNIGSVKLYFVKDDQPDGGTISYSTDGSNWTVAKTFENSEISSSDYLYSCDIDGAPLAKYVRLTLTSPHSGWWFRLAEFAV